MKNKNEYEIILIGGSYSGLAAAMALGRAMRKVLIIDSASPCNRQTPHSHNFLTQDGSKPGEIVGIARAQVEKYPTVSFLMDTAIHGTKTENGFEIKTLGGKSFRSDKIIFATGIKDQFPGINGFSACWGISVLHCPYCHGYEVKGKPSGLLGNGEKAFDFAKLLSNWTNDLTIFTNGPSQFTPDQKKLFSSKSIKIEEKVIQQLDQHKGQLKKLVFKDQSEIHLEVLYSRLPFKQHSDIPLQLGVELTQEGYLKVDAMQRTSIPGVYACGDNCSVMRTVANAVSTGTTAGMMLNKEMVEETFIK